MSETNNSAGVIVTGKDGSGPMGLVQLLAVKGALRMESLGMRRSGGNIRKGWAIKMGLKPNAKHAEIIKAIDERLEWIKANGEYKVEQI